MKTKTVATLAIVGIVGYLIYRKMAKPAGVGDDLLTPSNGRTVTAGGTVLNGLGLEQSYDAAPYQYRRRALNDMSLGFGISSVKKAVKKSVSATKKVVSKVAKPALKVAKVAAVVMPQGIAAKAALSIALNPKIILNPKEALKKGFHNIVQIPKKAMITTVGLVYKPRAEAPAGTEVEYQDENGNVITKAQYDALMEQYAAQNRADAAAQKAAKNDAAIQKQINALLAQRLKIVNSIPAYKEKIPKNGVALTDSQRATAVSLFNQKNAKVINQKKAQIAAIDKKIQALVNKLSTTIAAAVITNVQTSTNVQDTAIINQTGTPTTTPTITYTPEQAAAEEASITAPTDDSGYSAPSTYIPPSSGNSYSAEAAAAEQASLSPYYYDNSTSEAPALPENVTSVETPSAQVLPEEAAPVEEPKKTSGLVVGGGILAAIAAGFALTR